MKKNCPFQEQVSVYLFEPGQFTDQQNRDLETHLNNCPMCRQEFEKLKSIKKHVLQTSPVFPDSAWFQRLPYTTLQHIKYPERRSSTHYSQNLRPVVSFLFFAILFWGAYYYFTTPPPINSTKTNLEQLAWEVISLEYASHLSAEYSFFDSTDFVVSNNSYLLDSDLELDDLDLLENSLNNWHVLPIEGGTQ